MKLLFLHLYLIFKIIFILLEIAIMKFIQGIICYLLKMIIQQFVLFYRVYKYISNIYKGKYQISVLTISLHYLNSLLCNSSLIYIFLPNNLLFSSH